MAALRAARAVDLGASPAAIAAASMHSARAACAGAMAGGLRALTCCVGVARTPSPELAATGRGMRQIVLQRGSAMQHAAADEGAESA